MIWVLTWEDTVTSGESPGEEENKEVAEQGQDWPVPSFNAKVSWASTTVPSS